MHLGVIETDGRSRLVEVGDTVTGLSFAGSAGDLLIGGREPRDLPRGDALPGARDACARRCGRARSSRSDSTTAST